MPLNIVAGLEDLLSDWHHCFPAVVPFYVIIFRKARKFYQGEGYVFLFYVWNQFRKEGF